MTFGFDKYNQNEVGDARRPTCFGGAGAALGLGALPVLGSRLPAILAGAEGGLVLSQ